MTVYPKSFVFGDIIQPQDPIYKHPEYPDILEAIEEYGGLSKAILVAAVYDQSGESHTIRELNKIPRGKLLAMLIDQMYSG